MSDSPVTISQLREWGRQQLAEAGSETPALDSEVLLSHVLSLSREHILTRGQKEVSAAAEQAFRSSIRRRMRHEPVAYITGVKEFFERDFLVSPAVLIPRPDTEILVERALRFLLELPAGRLVRLIDVGTGSGAIVLSVLSELLARKGPSVFSSLDAVGLDISPEALETAGSNARRFGLDAHLRLVQSDLLTALPPPLFSSPLSSSAAPLESTALVLANLPYIVDREELPPGVEQFEPRLALRGGADGLELISRLLEQIFCEKPFQQGMLLMELGHEQALEVDSRLFRLCGRRPAFLRDLQGIERVAEISIGEK
jgi:release factor glutamine methyltransferase